MTRSITAYPPVATRARWLDARRALLAREKEATHLRDAGNAERRQLPMVRVEKDYRFEGPNGELGLVDMFESRHQLYIHHFMWIDDRDEGCPSCTAAADLTFTDKDVELLHAKDVAFACEYNYMSLDELHQNGFTDQMLRGDWPAASVFLRRGDEVFHTYTAYARGLDHTAAGYPFLELTPYRRQEAWEDSPEGWPKDGVAAGYPQPTTTG